MTNFKGAHPSLALALGEKGYQQFTPVQEAALDQTLTEADLLVSAQTGSGKTVAFGLALAPTLLGEAVSFEPTESPLALVIAPTRELALQVKKELDWLYSRTWAKLASCVGGMDMRDERRALAQGAHIVVGTPGRLCDHIKRGSLDMTGMRAIVLDEADEMLKMGFREELEFILAASPETRRTLMFSATVPAPIVSLAKKYQRDAVRVNTAAEAKQHVDIEYRALTVAKNDRENAIINVLQYYDAKNAIVFGDTRVAVNRMTTRFNNRGLSVVSLSGELNQKQRTDALQALRDGRAKVCIATDVAARGIDLPDLELVVHADMPKNEEALLHRSGRTGRAGRKGVSALIVPHNGVRRVERLLKSAKIKAIWAHPPSMEEVLARENERMLTALAPTDSLNEEERDMAARIVEAHPPEIVAAAFIRQYRAGRSAPEELMDVPASDGRGGGERSARSAKVRNDFENGVWFSLNAGRKQRAEPRWIVPMLCKAGKLKKAEIGAIRLSERETFIEISPDGVEKFVEAIGPDGKIEKSLIIHRIQGMPDFNEKSGDRRVGKPKRPRSHEKGREYKRGQLQQDKAEKRANKKRKPGAKEEHHKDKANDSEAIAKPKKPHKKKLKRAAAAAARKTAKSKVKSATKKKPGTNVKSTGTPSGKQAGKETPNSASAGPKLKRKKRR